MEWKFCKKAPELSHVVALLLSEPAALLSTSAKARWLHLGLSIPSWQPVASQVGQLSWPRPAGRSSWRTFSRSAMEAVLGTGSAGPCHAWSCEGWGGPLPSLSRKKTQDLMDFSVTSSL